VKSTAIRRLEYAAAAAPSATDRKDGYTIIFNPPIIEITLDVIDRRSLARRKDNCVRSGSHLGGDGPLLLLTAVGILETIKIYILLY